VRATAELNIEQRVQRAEELFALFGFIGEAPLAIWSCNFIYGQYTALVPN